VKATLIRITLHSVHADDYPLFHNAMLSSLRASCLGDPRFTESGLSVAELDALLPHLVEFAEEARSKADLEKMLEARLGFSHKGVWWALRRFAPLWHAPNGGAWSFGPRPSYVAALAQASPSERPDPVRHVVWRYLEGFGPATVQDIAQFTLLRRPVIRDALRLLDGEVKRLEGPERSELFDLPGAALPDEDTPAPPRLMAMWDSVLLAYSDRSRVIPPQYRPLVIRRNGDVLPTLLVDGRVAGVWRSVEGHIEATAFHHLPDEAWAGLASEAESLRRFLAVRDPRVYSRYNHWWKTLPSGEVRVLTA
jgi:hypothetical protein